ncbi:28S ribosomal protein S29, mitochondrial isoform X1 [Apis dorsata]|uniref:28S ribosomal protein S29, mitochondrial isoform X1 n=1 Tax=Apis dorsata TaxID=7462 RepID=UPI0003DF6846|nr:28S ribosomal protein S29, mitochondrial isoform X1 [Apis dorsata]
MVIYNCISGSLFGKMCIKNARRTIITAATKDVQDINLLSFRTELNPVEHDESCLNKIYTLPSDITSLLMKDMTIELKKQATIFREFGILVRKPAIELISYLEQTDYTKSINKYVLYGKEGVGKTTTLLHLIHYGLVKHFIVVYLPWVRNWFRYAREVSESPLIPGKLDLPQLSAAWLKYLNYLNETSLSQYNLKTTKEYTWSQKEVTKCGETLSNLIKFGIERTKFACGVVNALLDELKLASTAGKCKTLVIIDGFNAFTSTITHVCDENHKYVPPEKISITSAFYNIVNYDWCNGAAILTVDKRANKDRKDSDYPKYLLGKKGFEHLDPFLPIHVENYSKEEFKTILEYYKDRKWIRNISPLGIKELELLSNRHPVTLWRLCKPL